MSCMHGKIELHVEFSSVGNDVSFVEANERQLDLGTDTSMDKEPYFQTDLANY